MAAQEAGKGSRPRLRQYTSIPPVLPQSFVLEALDHQPGRRQEVLCHQALVLVRSHPSCRHDELGLLGPDAGAFGCAQNFTCIFGPPGGPLFGIGTLGSGEELPDLRREVGNPEFLPSFLLLAGSLSGVVFAAFFVLLPVFLLQCCFPLTSKTPPCARFSHSSTCCAPRPRGLCLSLCFFKKHDALNAFIP